VKPPECVVCGADAQPPGSLVRFRSRPEDLAWRERVEREGLVGHPPDTGWLCDAHLEAGRALASDETLADAVALLRAPRGDGAIRPVAVSDFGARLRALAPQIAEALGVPSPVLVARETRHWHPMDGAVAPDCPFTDDIAWTLDESPLSYTSTRAWWGEGALARASESLIIRTASVSASISGHIPADGSTELVSELTVSGIVPPTVAALVASEFPAA
jgi:hypothetical protein